MPTSTPLRPDGLEVLLQSRGRFVSFLERRAGSRAAAEEILQAAYIRALERGGDIAPGESAVTWFYRLLRNALIDRARRQSVETSGKERLRAEPPDESDDVELRKKVCACMHDLLPNLKPEYRDLVRKVDLEEQSLPKVASESGITSNNAGVRLHRARKALKRELERTCRACAAHGCLDCTCAGRR